MQRLSRPITEMDEHYDVVVVGSGYGGGITASRVARTGRSVCVLERGKELLPGEYPDSALSAPRHIQAQTMRGHIGSPTALIDFRFGRDISVVQGCGLGGTSLINANVALRADERVFFDDRWPVELKDENGVNELTPYYVRAEHMLGSKLPPADLPELPKFTALQRSAAALGTGAEPARVNVTFRAGPNAAGVMQNACTLCGDCVSGCNHGAKNTVLMNYLPDAHKHGAHIFTEVQVRTVRRRGDGKWLVEYTHLGNRRRWFGATTQFVTADVVVLSAGSLGSTEILLRSRAAGLQLSERLGKSFTGNGDVVAFAFDTDASTRSIGAGRRPVIDPIGPCISGTIDLRETEPGMLIQEGAIPGATGAIAPFVWALSALAFGRDGTRGLRRLVRRLRQLLGAFLGPRHGPAARTLTYLVMSIDDDNGELELDQDRLAIRWPNVGARPVFRWINDALERAATSIGGTFVPNPTWASPIGSTLLAVQPLGGCDMGNDTTHGVVDHKGRVFSGDGSKVHDGLYVADGAVIPRPLGANPSLTISAIAERISHLLITDRAWGTDARVERSDEQPRQTGIRFSERMRGFVSTHATADYGDGYAKGRDDASPIDVVLTIAYDDVDRVLRDQRTRATLTGTVVAPAISSKRLTATGVFRFFVPDDRRVETANMIYDLNLRDEDDRRFTLRIFKVLRERGTFNAWVDATTGYARLIDAGGDTIAVGIVRVQLLDFIKQVASIDALNAPDARSRRRARMGFMKMFVRKMISIYGGALDAPGQFPKAPVDSVPIVEGLRPLRLPPVQPFWRDTEQWHQSDRPGPGAYLQLLRFKGGDKGPVLLAPGFAMSATCYLANTTDQNLTEFLCRHDYDVWLFDNRGGKNLPSADEPYTLDQVATEDWPQAVEFVRSQTGAESVQVVAHCTGSLTFQMAMLSGMEGVRSAVLSAMTSYMDPGLVQRIKNRLHVEDVVEVFRNVTPYTRPTLRNQLIDILLRLHPIDADERCGQAICRWMNLIYGTVHHHPQLNDATHKALHSMYGVGNLTAAKRFAKSWRKGHIVDANGGDSYLEHPERLEIPILFLHGDRNTFFLPSGSEKTYTWLRDTTRKDDLFKRVVLPGYAHVDAFIGRDAHRDVFPYIVEHLDETATVPRTVPAPTRSPA